MVDDLGGRVVIANVPVPVREHHADQSGMDQCRQLMEMQRDSGWAVVVPGGSAALGVPGGSADPLYIGNSIRWSLQAARQAATEMPHAIRPGLNELWISTKASKCSATGWRWLCGHWALRQ
ncbi:hypothetical protein SRHO_G00044900 [Serrasalmus rhombeus]